ncbi:hypothetical protein J6590_074683 [Homalodisca vitripennis]|nr:hypothetical protein J6590_074683 [Homalodisca vitripennis]
MSVDDRLIATVNWDWNGYVDMSRRNPEYRTLLCKVKAEKPSLTINLKTNDLKVTPNHHQRPSRRAV